VKVASGRAEGAIVRFGSRQASKGN
jgi:hypothetical protein